MTVIKTRDPGARQRAEIYAQATLRASERFHERLRRITRRESTGGRFKHRRFCGVPRRRDAPDLRVARNFVNDRPVLVNRGFMPPVLKLIDLTRSYNRAWLSNVSRGCLFMRTK